jgi:L,D-peptidoglycan transpeptidase YkuD (ErfK/YbiS/YcfS/YnhG family)
MKGSILSFGAALACLVLAAASSRAAADGVQDSVAFLNRARLPEGCGQVIMVTSDGWDTRLGVMRLYEKTEGVWQPMKDAEFHVDIGKKGLGWGRGIFPADGKAGPHKTEGDGKAPAGVFELGDVFGYEAQAPAGCKMPYRQATERDYFVDDITSPDYNQWVRLEDGPNEPEKRWKSFERMRRADNRYRLGLVVRHNMTPVEPGKGSAIFMHLWEEPGTGTAGCTSMSPGSMLTLLAWLDPRKNPLLVQLPSSELGAGLSEKE